MEAKLKDNLILLSHPSDLEHLKVEMAINMIKGVKMVDYPWQSIPLTQENIETLISLDFDMSDDLMEWLIDSKKESKKVIETKIEGLKGELFEYQKEGVAFLERKNGRAFLADEMGLGKSLQSLAYCQRNPDKRPIVVVCPASLKMNWKAEVEKWTNIKAEVVKGTKPYQTKAELVIINYDIVYAWVENLRKNDFKVLILDEATFLKESTARRTKSVKRLAKGIQHVICLSGTPILNRPAEIFNATRIINPDLFESPKDFYRRYCNLRYNGFGWTYEGATHIPELRQILFSTVFLRRLKKDVLKDLPDKIYSFVPIEIDNESEYKKAESDWVEYIREKKGNEEALRAERAKQFASIEGLKQLSVKGKIKQAIEWIDNFLEVDGKLVVFCNHHFVVDTLMERFKDVAVKLDGRDTMVQKNQAVDKFMNEERIRLFIGNIKAAGQGLTLTSASNVAFLEYPFSPMDLDQASSRCHRIGQKDSVNIHYLLGMDTIEEKIAKILDRKRLVCDALMDGKETESESLITELIRMYSEPQLKF